MSSVQADDGERQPVTQIVIYGKAQGKMMARLIGSALTLLVKAGDESDF
ncbi:hypothetical protein [Pararhizobium sp. PWRC1-1]